MLDSQRGHRLGVETIGDHTVMAHPAAVNYYFYFYYGTGSPAVRAPR
jgi:hypothetical protein